MNNEIDYDDLDYVVLDSDMKYKFSVDKFSEKKIL